MLLCFGLYLFLYLLIRLIDFWARNLCFSFLLMKILHLQGKQKQKLKLKQKKKHDPIISWQTFFVENNQLILNFMWKRDENNQDDLKEQNQKIWITRYQDYNIRVIIISWYCHKDGQISLCGARRKVTQRWTQYLWQKLNCRALGKRLYELVVYTYEEN